MIEALTGFPDNVAAFACHGHVTHADYTTVLVPDVDKRLARHDKLRIYYEVGPDFTGIDPGAAWEDTKTGLAHWFHWERMAVVTDLDWISHAVKMFGFLMPGQFRVFPLVDSTAAREWIAG